VTHLERLSTAIKRVAVNASANGANVVVAGVPGFVIVAVQWLLISSAQMNITWQSSGGTVLSGPLPAAANGGALASYSPVGWFQTPTGEGLTLFLGGANQVGGSVSYVVVDPSMLP
jgi:hypothetical protein